MAAQTTKKSPRNYDTSFKEDVLKMMASGRPVREIAQSLGIGENLIYRWKSNLKHDSTASSQQRVGESTVFPDVERLLAELRRTQQERDILKKALNILGREQ